MKNSYFKSMKPDSRQVLFPNKFVGGQTVQLIDRLLSNPSNLSKLFVLKKNNNGMVQEHMKLRF